MIKTIVREKHNIIKQDRYPRILKHDSSEMYVYFWRYGAGVVIAQEDSNYKEGYYNDGTFNMSRFKPFHGTIEITSELD